MVAFEKAEDLSNPHIITGVKTPPLATSRSRGWDGIMLEVYRHWLGDMTAEYPFHAVSVQVGGTRSIFQRRNRRALMQTTRTGTVIVTPMGGPKEWRHGEQSDDCTFVILNLSPSLINGMLQASGTPHRDVEILDNFGTRDLLIEGILIRLLEETQTNDIAQGIYVEALRNLLCVHLLRRYSTLKTLPDPATRKLSANKLKRAIEFIDSSLAQDLTVSSIAEVLCMSPSHFARSFRQAIGVAPHQFVLERRIALAKRLLRNSNRPISHIAQQTGFSTPSHFSGTFARIVGRTPRRYRNDD